MTYFKGCAMGLIYDIASLVVKKAADDRGAPTDLLKNQGKMNSITRMAKSAIFSYPVLISEGIVGNDEDLMYAICSYLETQYAGFTLIAMGLNPIFSGTDPKSHIATFYSEESESLVPVENYKSNAIISIPRRDAGYKVSPDNMKVYKQSFEAALGIVAGSGDSKDGDGSKTSARLVKLEEKVRNSDPTVINVKLKMADNQHEVEFPVAVKASPRFITSQESETIFSYLKDDKPLVRLIKLLSGEIGLFKDIVFQLKRAKDDKDLYAKLGRHPWFRALMQRRNNRRINGLLQLIPGIDNLINGNSDILPICTLCVTKDELEQGFSNLWANIKKSDDNIMDKLMLLCLCVVDTTTSVVEFDFYGLKNNQIFKSATLIRENGIDKDKGKDMEKLIQSLIYKV